MDRIGLTGSTGSLGKIFLKKNKNKNIKCFKGDIRDRKYFDTWIKKIELIFYYILLQQFLLKELIKI